jgi:hypothetical protein
VQVISFIDHFFGSRARRRNSLLSGVLGTVSDRRATAAKVTCAS